MGRLIDADVMKQNMRGNNPSNFRGVIYEWIDSQPTVDAVPVVHSRWVYYVRHRKVYSLCTGFDAAGEEHTITVCEESEGKEPYCERCGAQAAESFMNYCPRCGAKMDGRDEQ